MSLSFFFVIKIMVMSMKLFQFGFDFNFLDGKSSLASFGVLVDHIYISSLEYVYSELLLILKLVHSFLLIFKTSFCYLDIHNLMRDLQTFSQIYGLHYNFIGSLF